MKIPILFLGLVLFLFSPGNSIAADPGDGREEGKSLLPSNKKVENIRVDSARKAEVYIVSDSELTDSGKKKTPGSQDMFCTCMPVVKPENSSGLAIRTIKPAPDVTFTLHVKKLNVIPNSASKQKTLSRE
jgi:hypothetical protein